MYNSGLLKILRELDKKEWKRIRLFSGAYLANGAAPSGKNTHGEKRTSLADLVNYLHRFYPDFEEDKKLTYETLLQKVYATERSRGPAKLNDDWDKLKGLAEELLILKELESKTNLRAKLLIAAFETRKLHDERKEQLAQILKKLITQKTQGTETYHLRSELSAQLFFHPGTEKFRTDVNLLTDAIANLEAYYLLSKLRLLSEHLHRCRTLNVSEGEYDNFDEKSLPPYDEDSVIGIYAELVKFLRLKDPNLPLRQLRERFEEKIDGFEDFDKRHIPMKILYLANYFYEKGHLYYLDEIFSVFKFLDAKGLLADNGQLSNVLFVSIVAVAANKGDYVWAEKFMSDHQNAVRGPHDKAADMLAKAHIDYYKKRFKQALAILEDASKNHAANYVQSETLYICICYDLIRTTENEHDYDHKLEKSLDRFRKYLGWHKDLFTPHKTEAIVVFFDLIKAMVRCSKVNISKKDRIQMKTTIELRFHEAKSVYCGGWLYQRIQQL